uniref:Uncharacterized protein n=1 Tax=Amphimedon queenslandica TaxID=400682 RepID=A0A1X7TKX1_AMPQE
MTTREGYIAAQSVLGLVGPLIVVVGMFIAGMCLKPSPDKLVRIMFPYINRHGTQTVMFGYVIGRVYIIFLFVIILVNIYFTMAIFFAHVVIVRSETYNPFGGFDCFDENRNEVNSTTMREAFELRRSNRTIECYAWQLNMAGAVGQATGTLLFSWAVVSVVTWIILKTHKKISRSKYKKYKDRILGVIQFGIYMIPASMTAGTAVLRSVRFISLLSYLELLAFCIILWASTMVLHCFLSEELDTIEDLIDKGVRDRVDSELSSGSNEGVGEMITRKDITTTYKENIKKLIGKMAEVECQKAVTNKIAVYLEEDLETVTTEAFSRVRQGIIKETERPVEGTQNDINDVQQIELVVHLNGDTGEQAGNEEEEEEEENGEIPTVMSTEV